MITDSRELKSYHVIIGVDQGYGNIKTANTCFKAGVTVYDKDPYFKGDMVFYGGKYYVIGEQHKTFIKDKDEDEDYYVLTLAAIAKEMKLAGMNYALVFLAVGVPLNWIAEQRDRFRKYLQANRHVVFWLNGEQYTVDIDGVEIFPQGFAHVAPYIAKLEGITMICDIGNGTINVMKLTNGIPSQAACYTRRFGVNQCMIRIQERMQQEYGTSAEEKLVEEVLITGTARIGEKALTIIREEATKYADEVMGLLRELGYTPDLMNLHIVGGGGCIIKNFGTYDESRVTINDDIMAAAKGYEYLAQGKLERKGML